MTTTEALVTQRDQEPEPSLLHVLKADEELYVQARAIDAVIGVTDRRLIVTTNGRFSLDVSFGEIRRIQFDIERQQPATFVIVPESPSKPPEVLSIPASEYDNVARVLALIGQRIAQGE